MNRFRQPRILWRDSIKSSKKERDFGWVKALVTALLTSGIAGFSGYIIASVNDTRERTQSKMDAVPRIVAQINANPSFEISPTLFVVNEGPVAASSLIVEMEMWAVTPASDNPSQHVIFTLGVRSQEGPWVFMTNSLPGAGVIKHQLSGAKLNTTNDLLCYRLEVRYFPEFNYSTPYSEIFYFGKYDGQFFGAERAIAKDDRYAWLFNHAEATREENSIHAHQFSAEQILFCKFSGHQVEGGCWHSMWR